MSNPFLKAIVRTRFRFTSEKSVEKQTKDVLRKYLALSKHVDKASGAKSVTVPSMIGVDEDMRQWSFFSLLQHNTIVNHAISANIRRLALGEPPLKIPFDAKSDVMPSADCGTEQVELFEKSVTDHLAMIPDLPTLRGTLRTNHPLFGSFDAHMWNCMFAFHLEIHLKQASIIAAG